MRAHSSSRSCRRADLTLSLSPTRTRSSRLLRPRVLDGLPFAARRRIRHDRALPLRRGAPDGHALARLPHRPHVRSLSSFYKVMFCRRGRRGLTSLPSPRRRRRAPADPIDPPSRQARPYRSLGSPFFHSSSRRPLRSTDPFRHYEGTSTEASPIVRAVDPEVGVEARERGRRTVRPS